MYNFDRLNYPQNVNIWAFRTETGELQRFFVEEKTLHLLNDNTTLSSPDQLINTVQEYIIEYYDILYSLLENKYLWYDNSKYDGGDLRIFFLFSGRIWKFRGYRTLAILECNHKIIDESSINELREIFPSIHSNIAVRLAISLKA